MVVFLLVDVLSGLVQILFELLSGGIVQRFVVEFAPVFVDPVLQRSDACLVAFAVFQFRP